MPFRQALLRAFLAVAAVMLVVAGPSFGVRQAASSRRFVRTAEIQAFSSEPLKD